MNTQPPQAEGAASPPEPEAKLPSTDDLATASVPAEPVRWGPLVKGLRATSKVVTRVLAGLCIVLFVWLVFVVVWQIFTRQILRNSAPWTAEAAPYSFVVLAMIAVAYVYSERGHIAVEMFVERLPGTAQKVWGIVVELVVIFFTIFVFIWGGIRVAENAWGQSLSILPLAVGQIYLVLPIAGALIVFYSLTHIVGILAGVEKPVPEFDENAEAI